MRLLAKTFSGLENVLETELKTLGATNIEVARRAVYFEGTKELLYKANYHLRTAISILIPLGEFKAEDCDDLYYSAKDLNWDEYLNGDTTYSIASVCNSPFFENNIDASHLVRDAIADHFREKKMERPTINKREPDILIDLLIAEDNCFISLNSSGEPLFKRGYREGDHPSPINEVLAAGMLKLSNWHGQSPLLDPMCGSGTIVIEAAMLANDTPAGFCREEYAFMKWGDFDETLWAKTKLPLLGTKHDVEIIACDKVRKNLDFTREALRKMGLSAKVQLQARDFLSSLPLIETGTIITNPPHGDKAKSGNAVAFYKSMGNHLRHEYQSWNLWFIAPKDGPLENLRLSPLTSFDLVNGDVDCVFQNFKVDGAPKKRIKPEQSEEPLQRVMRPRKKTTTPPATEE